MDNIEQIRAIGRFHQHLLRNDVVLELEQVARMWIARYGHLWREHRTSPLRLAVATTATRGHRQPVRGEFQVRTRLFGTGS